MCYNRLTATICAHVREQIFSLSANNFDHLRSCSHLTSLDLIEKWKVKYHECVSGALLFFLHLRDARCPVEMGIITENPLSDCAHVCVSAHFGATKCVCVLFPFPVPPLENHPPQIHFDLINNNETKNQIFYSRKDEVKAKVIQSFRRFRNGPEIARWVDSHVFSKTMAVACTLA